VDPHFSRRGIGLALLSHLIARCEKGGFQQRVAVIGDSANRASIALHQKLVFPRVGTLQLVGFKFGSWLDVVLMPRALGSGTDALTS
jgi:phosphinothricin acetyltransferase